MLTSSPPSSCRFVSSISSWLSKDDASAVLLLVPVEAGAELDVASVKASSLGGGSAIIGGCPLRRRLLRRETPAPSDVEGSADSRELEAGFPIPEPVVRRLVGIGMGREVLVAVLALVPVPTGVEDPLVGEPAAITLSKLPSVPAADAEEPLLPGPGRLVKRASTD